MRERTSIPRLVVAGVGSGTGKTTVALGLVSALRARGRSVQTFKVGPDFIDSAVLAHASRRPCRNLDSWMLGGREVVRSFARGAGDADRAVIEGTAGIFDGHGASGDGAAGTGGFPGSTAELARLIAAPVVLVIDVERSAETSAAVALGVRRLDPGLDLVGVVLNNVPSDQRRRAAEDAIWSSARLPVLGWLPHLPDVQIADVRSGLVSLAEDARVDPALARLGAAVERHCDVGLIERLMGHAPPVIAAAPATAAGGPPAGSARIGVAFDDAFCFYYAENLEQLEQAGGQVVTFSPLEDAALPPDLDAIYLGGGVSQALVPQLAANRGLMASLRRAHAHGVPIYAECGGLMYCARSLRTSDGTVHAMVGLLPVDIALEAGLCHTGYRDLRLVSPSILGEAGRSLRGHEFHFGRVLEGASGLGAAYAMHDAGGEPLGAEGWSTRNLLASFVHLHFGQDPQLAGNFVQAARERSRRRHLQAAGA